MGELTPGTPAAPGGSRPLARDEHLADQGGRPAARSARPRRARPAPRREGDGPRRRGAARAVLDSAAHSRRSRCVARPSCSRPRTPSRPPRGSPTTTRPARRVTRAPPSASTPHSTSRCTRPRGRAGSSALIRPAWDSCERYRPVLLSARGELQDRHEELDRELLAACTGHDPDRAGRGAPCPPRARDGHLRRRAPGPEHLRVLT